MIKTNTSTQNTSTVPSRDAKEQLYTLIRKRVKRTFLIRRLATVGDVTGDVYLLLIEQKLPDFESKEFERLLTETVRRVARRANRSAREELDVDELGDEDHPSYEMDFFSDEAEFETVFEKFYESQAEPSRSIFKYSRLIGKRDIADLLGISRNEVARIIKAMPDIFQKYITKNRDSV